MISRLAVVLITLSFLNSSVFAQPPVWEFLGERLVKFSTDRDVITVTEQEGVFRKIKFKVRKRGIEMIDLKVHFKNGEVQDVPMKAFIPRGGESRIIDLSGDHRIIQKVEFVYRSRGRGNGRALVKLWGMR